MDTIDDFFNEAAARAGTPSGEANESKSTVVAPAESTEALLRQVLSRLGELQAGSERRASPLSPLTSTLHSAPPYVRHLEGLATAVLLCKEAVSGEVDSIATAAASLKEARAEAARQRDDGEGPDGGEGDRRILSSTSVSFYGADGREMRNASNTHESPAPRRNPFVGVSGFAAPQAEAHPHTAEAAADDSFATLGLFPARGVGLNNAEDEADDLHSADAPLRGGDSAANGARAGSVGDMSSRLQHSLQSTVVALVAKSPLLTALSSRTYEAHHPLVTAMDLAYILGTAVLTIVVLDLFSASFFPSHEANNAPKEGSWLYAQHVLLLIAGQLFFSLWMLMRPLVRRRGRGDGGSGSLFEDGGVAGDSAEGRSRRQRRPYRKQRGFGLRRRVMGTFSSVSEWTVLDTPSQLWAEYTHTWFWFDLAVTVPWNLPYFISFGLVLPRSFLAVSSSVHLLRWVRAMTIGRSSEPLIATRRYLRFVRMFCAIVSFAHFCALLFPIVNPALGLSYLASLYYVMTTMTSVGYGDVTPRLTNNNGLAFGIAIMVIGVAAVGIFTASLTQYLNSRHHGQDASDALRGRLEGQLHGQFAVARAVRKRLTEFFPDAVAVGAFSEFWRKDLPTFPSRAVSEIEPHVMGELLSAAVLSGGGGCSDNGNDGRTAYLCARRGRGVVGPTSLLPAPSSILSGQMAAWMRQLASATVCPLPQPHTEEEENSASALSEADHIADAANTLPFPPRPSHLYRRRYAAGEFLFGAGDLLDGLFVVLAGSVDVFVPMASISSDVLTRRGGGGSEDVNNAALTRNRRSIALFRAGHVISSVAAFTPCVALATARCVSAEGAEVLVLSREWVLTVLAMADDAATGASSLLTSASSVPSDAFSLNIASSSLATYLAARRAALCEGVGWAPTVPHNSGWAAKAPISVVDQISAVLAGSSPSDISFDDALIYPIAAPLSVF